MYHKIVAHKDMQIFNIEMLLGIFIFLTNTYLGVLVFSRDGRSWTNRLYFLLVVILNAYIVTNFISLHPEVVGLTDQLYWIRVVMFVGSFIGPTLFCLINAFPGNTFIMKRGLLLALLILMLASAGLSMSPYLFTGLQYINGEVVPIPGPGIIVFLIDFVGLFILSFVFLWFKWKKAKGVARSQIQTIAYGITFSFSLMAVSTVIFVVVLNLSTFVFLGPLYTIFLTMATAYAIVKYNLFSVKVILVEVAVFLLNTFLFLNIFIFNDTSSLVLNGSVFLATLIFSVLLLRTIYKDIRVRERIEELAKQMMIANDRLRYMEKQKTEFVSIASHQLRTPLTVIKGYVSMIREGTFGPLSESARDAMDKLHKSSEKMVELVEDLLTVSRLEQKRAVLRFEVTDVVRMMRNIIAGVEDEADHVGLKMSLVAPADVRFLSMIDEKKFIQAIKHILDNAIRYTNPPGSVRIVISKSTLPGMIRISVSDTGMGMTEEKLRSLSEQLDFKASAVVARLKTIMPKTKHQPGEVLGQSEVKNAPTGDKTVGVGLYIAKEIISAHRGNIWAKSEGLNKGTTVIVEIPEVKN